MGDTGTDKRRGRSKSSVNSVPRGSFSGGDKRDRPWRWNQEGPGNDKPRGGTTEATSPLHTAIKNSGIYLVIFECHSENCEV